MIAELVYEVFKFIGDLNYWHVALLSALESTAFPVIIPVETVVIPMGYYAYLGTKSLPLLIISCTTGIVIGCLINYAFARYLGRAFIYKHAKFLHINIEKLQRLEAKFLTHGRLLMFVGRFVPIPAFKHIITIPAGMAKMPVHQFVFYNALGGLIFSTSMLLIGYFFGSSEELWRKALGKFVLVCFILLGLYIVVRLVIKMILKKGEKQEVNLYEEVANSDVVEHRSEDDTLFIGGKSVRELGGFGRKVRQKITSQKAKSFKRPFLKFNSKNNERGERKSERADEKNNKNRFSKMSKKQEDRKKTDGKRNFTKITKKKNQKI